jgi:hypothetical protein
VELGLQFLHLSLAAPTVVVGINSAEDAPILMQASLVL